MNNRFTADKLEHLMALLIWPLAFFYVEFFIDGGEAYRYLFCIFAVLFLLFGEAFYRNIPSSKESYGMLAMFMILVASICLDLGKEWSAGLSMCLLHLYAVYWVLCRSGKLLKGRTSNLFLLDGLNGCLGMPFKNFVLVFQTLENACHKKNETERKKRDWGTLFITVVAIVVGLGLFVLAMMMLSRADANFQKLFQLPKIKLPELNLYIMFFRLVFTYLVGSYLYGLLGGCYREPQEKIDRAAEGWDKFFQSMHKVPAGVWQAFIALFSMFYVVFFVMQGSYMVNAFYMILPKNMTYAQYARHGFFEMLGVMCINFALLWLTARTSLLPATAADEVSLVTNDASTDDLAASNVGGKVPMSAKSRVGCLALIVESMVFALIAALKLAMYISAYGFTFLRLVSIWFCLVMMCACLCLLYRVLTGKDTVRFWFMFSAATLVVVTFF